MLGKAIVRALGWLQTAHTSGVDASSHVAGPPKLFLTWK
jgi:hypothetical protein